MKQVMIDLETLSIKKNALILSMGAVVFDGHNVMNDTFYVNVHADSQRSFRAVDASTEEFWSRKENEGAFSMLTIGAMPLHDALLQLRMWLLRDANTEDIELWCNGMFDIPIIETALGDCNLPLPWKYWNERDYRTFKMTFRHIKKPEFNGTKHNALHDSINQAQHLVSILQWLRGDRANGNT